MSLTLDKTDWNELQQQQASRSPGSDLAWEGWAVEGVPGCLGRGHSRDIELYPGVWLACSDRIFHQDFSLKVPVHPHLVQYSVTLAGSVYIYRTRCLTCWPSSSSPCSKIQT